MGSIVDWIRFGQVSAEKDKNLSKYFFDNGVLGRLVNDNNQFLVLGRKGAGKTAVFQHFADNFKSYVPASDSVISFSLQNYDWDVHSLLQSKGKAVSLSYIQSWKYVVYSSVIKSLDEQGRAGKKTKSAARLLERLYISPAPSLGQAISSKLLNLVHLKLPGGSLSLDAESIAGIEASGGEVTFGEVRSSNELQSTLSASIDRLVAIFEDALAEQSKETGKVFVCFDRVDEAWDADSFEDSKKIIAGLIAACETITANLNALIRPIVFLREDIFESLALNDKNKLRADCGQLLAWDAQSLERMILKRINFYAREANEREFEKIADLFDKTQMRQQRKPFDYILMRTFHRPRDVIRMFELVRGDMADRVNNPYDDEEVSTTRLECQAIYNAEPAYSEWFLEEIKDEWSVQRPEIAQTFDAIQLNGSTSFSKDQFSSTLSKVGRPVDALALQKELRFLFDNSVIGLRVGKSTQWRFKCFFKTQGYLDVDTYKVHDGLARALNLTENRSSDAKDDTRSEVIG